MQHRDPLTRPQRWLLQAYATADLPPQVRWYRMNAPTSTQALRAALHRVVDPAPALRRRVAVHAGEWSQELDDRPVLVRVAQAPDVPQDSVLTWARDLCEAIPTEARESDHRASLSALHVTVSGGPDLVALLVDRFSVDGRGFDVLERLLDASLAGGRPEEARATGPDSEPRTGPFRTDAADIAALSARLVSATHAPLNGDQLHEPDVRKGFARRDSGSATTFLARCRQAGISPAMAYAAAQALTVVRLGTTGRVVVNVPVSFRRRNDRDTVANYSTLVHAPVNLEGALHAGELRSRVRSALMTSLRDRSVDPKALYGDLYRRLPHWPPGWNTFCNVRDGLRWSDQAVLTPIEEEATASGDQLPGLLTANARISPSGTSVEWLWDSSHFGSTTAQRLEELVDEVSATPADYPLHRLIDISAPC